MHRTVLAAAMRRVVTWVVIVVAVCGVATPAKADPRAERDAQSLRKKAIEEDSLNVNYGAAVKKLQSALARCGTSKCAPGIRAALLRDLGAMQILNGSVDDGKASFAQALAVDASIDLDPAYKNPMLDGIWGDVKKGGGAPAAPSGAAHGAQPSGDFTHAPPAEGQVHTPLAIYLEYSGSEQLGKVVAKYKGTGMGDWTSLDLKKVGDGYGALIPCKDVLQGSMQYYVVGFNAQNDPVATSGSRNKPFTVAVNSQIAGPVPSLPGHDPPTQCEDTAAGTECPPDFPGCKAPKKQQGEDCDKDAQCTDGLCIGGKCIEKKGGGEDCEADKECSSGECSDGKCSSKKGSGDTCEADDDCASGKCEDEKCEAGEGGAGGKLNRFWAGLSLQGDLYVMPAANNVCQLNSALTLPINTAGYWCVNTSNGAYLPGKSANLNSEIDPRKDQVAGGAAFGNLRILATLDYALNPNMMVGLRVGYVLFTNSAAGSPGPAFAPLHIEARFTYLFGRDALISKPVAFMLLGALGVGEFDAFVPVTVNALVPPGGSIAANAWLTAGPGFFALGPGLRVKLADRVAGTFAVKFEGPFGGTAGFLPGIAPELGVQYGF